MDSEMILVLTALAWLAHGIWLVFLTSCIQGHDKKLEAYQWEIGVNRRNLTELWQKVGDLERERDNRLREAHNWKGLGP